MHIFMCSTNKFPSNKIIKKNSVKSYEYFFRPYSFFRGSVLREVSQCLEKVLGTKIN